MDFGGENRDEKGEGGGVYIAQRPTSACCHLKRRLIASRNSFTSLLHSSSYLSIDLLLISHLPLPPHPSPSLGFLGVLGSGYGVHVWDRWLHRREIGRRPQIRRAHLPSNIDLTVQPERATYEELLGNINEVSQGWSRSAAAYRLSLLKKRTLQLVASLLAYRPSTITNNL